MCSSLFKSPAAACILSSDWTIPKNLHPADCTSSINNHMPRRPSGEGVGGFSRQIRLNRLSLVVDREPFCVCVFAFWDNQSCSIHIHFLRGDNQVFALCVAFPFTRKSSSTRMHRSVSISHLANFIETITDCTGSHLPVSVIYYTISILYL